MTFDEVVRARQSVRNYSDKPIPEEALHAILEAGRLAPSASNLQNWRFTAVLKDELREGMTDACNGQPFVAPAPCTLVVWATTDRAMQCGQSTASVDCSIALTHMMLKAAELGIGSCWLGNFDAEKMKKLLGLPADAIVVAATPLGYPAEQPPQRPRKAFDEVCEVRA